MPKGSYIYYVITFWGPTGPGPFSLMSSAAHQFGRVEFWILNFEYGVFVFVFYSGKNQNKYSKFKIRHIKLIMFFPLFTGPQVCQKIRGLENGIFCLSGLQNSIRKDIEKTSKRHQLSMTFPCVFRFLSLETKKHNSET